MPPTAREKAWSGAPKRSPSSNATGRAPIAATSRRMPPTPVAAPWNGSTAEGWLWLSTLNATASPSPRSSTPAFSPGPCSTRSPSLGSRFSRSAECLYPQCSDQRSEKTASSKSLGSRPRSETMRSSSPSVRPRARWSGCWATLLRATAYRGHPIAPPGSCGVSDPASSSLAPVRRYWPMLFLLAAIWGASYLFIKLAVEDIEPAPMMAARTLVAGAVLAAYLVLTLGRERTVRELRASWRPALVLGAVNAAIPFWLVGWGEKHIDSSVAGIAQSTVPIFTFLVAARFVPGEHVGALRVLGIALGFLGVAVLAGLDPRGGWWAITGTLAVVLSSLSYAFGGVYGQLRVRTVSGPVLATGLGQLILFRMLRLFGSRRLSLVTYLMPGFALVYGAVFLSEPITAAALGGLALILVGVALRSGQRLLGLRGREEPVTP